MRRLLVFLFLVAAFGSVRAEEALCTSMGSACICSEPIQGTLVPQDVHWLDPSDSTVKPCVLEAGDPIRVPNNNDEYSSGSDSAVLNLLPTGHSVTNYIRSNSGTVGGYHIGHILSGSAPVARVSIRFYRFYSSDVQITGDNGGNCTNGKIANYHDGDFSTPHGTVDHQSNSVQFYSILNGYTVGGSPVADCCFSGPNLGAGIGNNDSWKGFWWRFEYVITNRSTGPTTFVLYRKKITVANTDPEEIVIDTRTQDLSTGPNPWTNAMATTLTPNETLEWVDTDAYRAGTCSGYMAHMYLMVAGWNTDTGQRIDAASEVEGGGGGSPTPGSLKGAVLRGATVK